MYAPGCTRFHYEGPDSTGDVFIIHPASSSTVLVSSGVPLTSAGYYATVDITSHGIFPGDIFVRVVTDGGNTHDSPVFSLVVNAVDDWIPPSCNNTPPSPSPTRTPSATASVTTSPTPSQTRTTTSNPKVAVVYCSSAVVLYACDRAQTALTNLGWTYTTVTDRELLASDLVGTNILVDTTIGSADCVLAWTGGTGSVVDSFLTAGGHGYFQFEHNGFNGCNNIKLATLNNHIADAPLTGGATRGGICTVNTAANLGSGHGCAVSTPNVIGGTVVSCSATNDFNNLVDSDSSLVTDAGIGVHAIYGGSDSVGSSRMIFWSDVNWVKSLLSLLITLSVTLALSTTP